MISAVINRGKMFGIAGVPREIIVGRIERNYLPNPYYGKKNGGIIFFITEEKG